MRFLTEKVPRAREEIAGNSMFSDCERIGHIIFYHCNYSKVTTKSPFCPVQSNTLSSEMAH
jgi:hypothetical protein